MQYTFARATHSAFRLNGRPSAARDDRLSCIQTEGGKNVKNLLRYALKGRPHQEGEGIRGRVEG